MIQSITESEIDVFINSPGGFAEVTESLVTMLRSKFGHVRFIVPNMAKSAATLFCLSGNEILMDHRGELGPIDPQIEYPTRDGRKQEAAEAIIEGFEEAKEALVREGPSATPAYLPLLEKYTIGLLRGCKNAMLLSKQLAGDWLKTYMFADNADSTKPAEISEYLASHANTLSHSRAIGIDKCKEIGLNIKDLREPANQSLADKMWELWCVYELHFERSPVHKIYENSSGCSLEKQTLQMIIGPPPVPGQQHPQQPPQA